MLRPDDYAITESFAVDGVRLSDWHPWPALDFEHATANYTVLYGLDTDVFVLWRHNDDRLWTFKYRSDTVTFKYSLTVVVGEDPPLGREALAYLGAIIKHDVRKLCPTARAFRENLN